MMHTKTNPIVEYKIRFLIINFKSPGLIKPVLMMEPFGHSIQNMNANGKLGD
jgi:hypothetical protein